MGKFIAAAAPAFAIGLVKDLFEESVWRGYLTPEFGRIVRSDSALYGAVG